MWADPRHQRSQRNQVKSASLPIRNSPIVMYRSDTWSARSTVMERLHGTGKKWLWLGYFWPRVSHNGDLYAENDELNRLMARGRYQQLVRDQQMALLNEF
ncbi:hypothetical protein RB195_024096 [Necator americanus]|uniref:Uncharacterized protein n=1 Tax=Necator americanus TaxID=51031 RepID=A0ABR1EM06_NECAM